MNCSNFRKQISDLVTRHGARLNDVELLQHAAECAACAKELEDIRYALRAITPSQQLTASPRLKEKTMNQIYEIANNPAAFSAAPVRTRSVACKRTWLYAAGAAAATIAVVLTTLSTGPSLAFSQVVQKLANARALIIRGTVNVPGQEPIPTVMHSVGTHAFRMDLGNATTMIMNYKENKAISLLHDQKNFVTIDLSMLSESAKAMQQVDFVQKMKSLASVGTPTESRVMNGRTVQGFKASDAEASYLIWADTSTGEIVSAEYETSLYGGGRGVMEGFEYHDTIDESLFSLTPPAGYTSMQQPAASPALESSEEKFIAFLREYAEDSEKKQFPATLDPGTLVREMTQIRKARKLSIEEMRRKVQLRTSGTMFPITLKADNHFQYAGQGVTMGTPGTPIAWYKPTGAANYRVIYADLNVHEVSPDQLPKK